MDTEKTNPSMPPERLFIGVYCTGIVYADRGREERGDYKRVAFLPYDTLELEIDDPASPLLDEVRKHAAKLQGRAGELFAISVSGKADVAEGLNTGQTVRLGRRKGS